MADSRKTKGVKGDQSGKVMPFPTLDRVEFYREHLQRSMRSTLELYSDYVNIQDRLISEVIECENCMLELVEEIGRLEKVLNQTAIHQKEVHDASKI